VKVLRSKWSCVLLSYTSRGTEDQELFYFYLLCGNVYVDNLDEALKMCLTTHSLLASSGVIFILGKN
jgi:hypothetical protein